MRAMTPLHSIRWRPWAVAWLCALVAHLAVLMDRSAERAAALPKVDMPASGLQPWVMASVPSPVSSPAETGPPQDQGTEPVRPAALGATVRPAAVSPVPTPMPRQLPAPVAEAMVAAASPPPAAPLGAESSIPPPPADDPEGEGGSTVAAAALLHIPAYAARVPNGFRQALEMRRQRPRLPSGELPLPVSGTGELSFELDGQGAYALNLQLQLGALSGARPLLDMRSQGRVGNTGLGPERFTDRRQGRARGAANLDRQAREARFASSAAPVPLADAAQDRSSWLIQLPAVLRANPQLLRPGAVVWLQVVGARGGSQVWRFEAMGPENLLRPDGELVQGAWRWRREVEYPYDLQVEAWVPAPTGERSALPAIPAFVRLTTVPGGQVTEFWPVAQAR